MVEYKIIIKNENDIALGEFHAFIELKYGKRLNNYGMSQIVFSINDEKMGLLTALRRNSVWIYRDNVLKWSGEMAVREAALDDKAGGRVTLHSYDWLEQLDHRYTPEAVSYNNTDQGEIFWSEINTTQSQTYGNMGITRGTITATTPRDRQYATQNIMELGINLSNVIDGFDFEITNSKILNIYSTIGVDRTDSVIFEHGVNANVTNIIEDFKNPVNRAISTGQVLDPPSILRVDVDSTEDQEIYGIREGLNTDLDVSESGTLTEKGEALILKQKAPLMKVDVDILASGPDISQFALGDTVLVKVRKGIYDISEPYRVFEWEVSYDSDNKEKVSVVLAKFNI